MGVLAVALSALLLVGCAGPGRLRGGPAPAPATVPPPQTPAGRTYLQQLSAEQARLARAEAAIPRRARTPAALSRSIGLLADAIAGLHKGLRSIRPPAAVAKLHSRLITEMSAYHRHLAAAAKRAGTRTGELGAANALASATNTASRQFTATFSEITAALAHH